MYTFSTFGGTINHMYSLHKLIIVLTAAFLEFPGHSGIRLRNKHAFYFNHRLHSFDTDQRIHYQSCIIYDLTTRVWLALLARETKFDSMGDTTV